MANPFVHVELQTQALDKSVEFYGQLFNWKLEDMPMGDSGEKYVMISVGDGTGGGMMQHPMADAPSCWVPYVQVDNLSETTSNAKNLGATILKENCEVPDHGWFTIIQDPTGAVLGFWQDK